MTTNNFNSEYDNDSIVPLQTFNDGSGIAKLDNLNISSYAFDGAVPNTTVNLIAASITPGMKISLTGSALGEPFYKVISNTASDAEIEDNETGNALIQYIDSDRNVQSLTASVSDIFSVNYEDWNNKYLGTKGWYLSNDGNAIFSNVAVRGRVEATEGRVEDLIIGESYFPILNIYGVENQSSSVVPNKGQLIMYVVPLELSSTQVGKLLYKGDIVKISGTSASGWIYSQAIPSTASNFFNIYNRVKVLSASYSQAYSGPVALVHKYHCEVVQEGFLVDFNLGSLSASSGSFTFGAMNMGDYKTYSLANQDTIEGFVFHQIGQGGTWDDYIPDYLDVSGRFRLGGGKLIFDGQTLSVDAVLSVGNLSASYTSYDFLSASYANLSGLATSGTTIINGGNITTGNIKSSGYSGPGTGSAFSTTGTLINLNDGSVASKQFRIDSSGNATFSGGLNAATGTFAGSLSAATGTFSGTLSANSITSGTLNASIVNVTNLNANNIVSGSITSAIISGNNILGGTITGQNISGGTITGATINSAASGQRVSINSNSILIYDSSGTQTGTIYAGSGTSLFAGSTTAIIYGPGTVGLSNSVFSNDYYITGGLLYGSGAQLSSLNANNISSGTLNASRLPYTMNQNVGTGSTVEFANINVSNMTAGQGTHYVHWNNTGTPGATYRLSRTTSTALASSQNIKSYIEPIEISNEILDYEFTTVKFKYNTDVEEFGDDAEYRVGIIAEEMAEIPTVRELVQYDDNGNPVGFDYQKLSLILFQLMQRQKIQIESLETRIASLESS